MPPATPSPEQRSWTKAAPDISPDRWTRASLVLDLVVVIASGILLMGFACAYAALLIR